MLHLPTGKTRKAVTTYREQHKPSNLIVSPLLVGLRGKSLELKGICNAGFSKHAFGIHKEKAFGTQYSPCPASFVFTWGSVETLHCILCLHRVRLKTFPRLRDLATGSHNLGNFFSRTLCLSCLSCASPHSIV